MKVPQLRRVADDLGQKKIIKLIEKEVEKALESDDEIIVTVQLDNGLQFFLSLEDDEDDPA